MSVVSLKEYINLENYSDEENENSEDASTVKIISDSSDASSEPDSLIQEIEEISKGREKELKERLESLRGEMASLQENIQHEKKLCKEIMEELTNVQDKHTECMYAVHFHHNNVCDFPSTSTFPTCLPIDEYEIQINNYQDALRQTQTYNRANLKRQLAITNYRRQLLEVENMCNLELLKVKQNVQNLQPLRQIVSEWEREMNGAIGDYNDSVSKGADEPQKINSYQNDCEKNSMGDSSEVFTGDQNESENIDDSL